MTMTTVSTSKTPPPDASDASAAAVMDRFESATATIGVVGLGYVGLPLVRAAHAAGFPVIGYDRDRTKIDTLKRGETYLKHLGADLAKELAASERFKPTTESKDLVAADAILLCVPTPLGPHREPDLSFVLDSTKMVAGILRKRRCRGQATLAHPAWDGLVVDLAALWR